MIGFLPEERLTNIPAAYRDQHELCFYLHDAMVSLLKGAGEVQASTLSIRLESPEEAEQFMRRNDPIEYFLDRGEVDIARRIALNQVTPALFADFLHFIYETLSCLERRKFVVAFALLRKPMQQNLLFASWILADEAAFFEDLRRSPADHMEEHKFPADKRIQIFRAALSKVEHYGLLDASLINEIIYNKELPKGFAHLFAKANHLVTSRGQLARTESMNLNFIFKNPTDNDVYESIYLSLSYLLWYALLIQIALFSRMRAVEDSFTRWMTITTMATFDALFVSGSSHLAAVLSKALGKFMNCPHCKKKVSIGRKATGRFFLAQRVHCKNCKNEYDFPLFWLLSQVDWSVMSSESEKDRARLRGLFREPVA
jgi:hypothetical protein